MTKNCGHKTVANKGLDNMDVQERKDLLMVSKVSSKLEKLMECKDTFETLINEEAKKLKEKKPFENLSNTEDSLESHMMVCVRVRSR